VAITNLTEGTDYTVDYVAGTVTFLTATATAEAAGTGLQIGYEWLRKSEADLTGKVMRQIDQSVTTQLNMTSDEIFGGNSETDSFEAVIRMMQGMHTNNQDDIKTGVNEHDAAFKRLLGAEAVNGSRYNQVEVNLGRVQDRNIETTRIQSELEDLDFAKAISDFTLAESVYKASLSSAARVLQPSLLDFV
jgi:flagellar hook-associated protein 3 FlgL